MMARGRILSRSISTSKKVNRNLIEYLQQAGIVDSVKGVLLYTWLHPHADDWGKMDGDAYSIKMNVVPGLQITENEVEIILKCLHDSELIVLYSVDNKRYLQIVDFEKHQSGLHKRTKSNFPEIPGNSDDLREILGRTEEKGIETEQEQKKEKEVRIHTPEKPPARPIAKTDQQLSSEISVFRLHDSEFKLWMNKIVQMIAVENQARPRNRFVWPSEVFESNMKTLIYSPFYRGEGSQPKNDDAKKNILDGCYNTLGDKWNWPELVKLAIMMTVKASEKQPIKNPLGFVLEKLKKPNEIASDNEKIFPYKGT